MAFIKEDEYIYIKYNSLSSEICDDLIRLFETDLSYMVVPGVTANNSVSDIKQTLDLKIQREHNPYDDDIFKELNLNINYYFNSIITRYRMNIIGLSNLNDSGFQIQKYIRETGQYKYHNDFTHSKINNQMRMITFLWYLNTVDEGGETEFFNGRIKIKPEKGKLILFPSTWTYIHRGNMPISSDKYILTGWIYCDMW
jgi:hypothetical protein